MRDPVTGYEYPDPWVSSCNSQEARDLVARGLAVLTASGTVLRRGFTTGTTAAAACKAAILSQRGPVASVRIRTPCGIAVDVPVRGAGGSAECRKYSGDYPGDATAGIRIIATAEERGEGFVLEAGAGIGTYGRTTPRFRKGTPAITEGPLSCILQSVEEALMLTGLPGISILLSVPDGEAVAAHTLNSRVGVMGGISILGSTGLVEPWDDHLGASVLERVTRAPRVVLTTGRIGLRYARLCFPEHEVVLVGSRIREALSAAAGEVVLFGLPALILKFIRPDILGGTGYETVEEMCASPDFSAFLSGILARFRQEHPDIRVIIINRDGDILGESP